jgi:hypothetical protein
MFCVMGSDCDEAQDSSENKISVNRKQTKIVEKPEVTNHRFTVKSCGHFYAGYESNKREILVLTDTETKKEYLVVTGCGVEIITSGDTKKEE